MASKRTEQFEFVKGNVKKNLFRYIINKLPNKVMERNMEKEKQTTLIRLSILS